IVSVRDDGPVNVRVVANRPGGLGEQRASFDTRTWGQPRTVAEPVGPHLVRLGWFPRVRSGVVRVYRIDASGRRTLAGSVPAPSSSWDDAAVRPGETARYAIARPHAADVPLRVEVPPRLPDSAAGAVRGKSA